MSEEMKQVPIDLSHVFELLSNKKNDILDIDYSNDNDSYPTVRAVKNYIDNIVLEVSDVSGKENISNKVTDIRVNDYTGDTVSYQTVQAVKDYVTDSDHVVADLDLLLDNLATEINTL